MNIKRKKRINRFEVDSFPLLDLGTRNLCRSQLNDVAERLGNERLDRYETIFESFGIWLASHEGVIIPTDKIFRNEVSRLPNSRNKINTQPLIDHERSLWYEVYFPVREDVRNKIIQYNLKYVDTPTFWNLSYPLKSSRSEVKGRIMRNWLNTYTPESIMEIILRNDVRRKHNAHHHLMLI